MTAPSRHVWELSDDKKKVLARDGAVLFAVFMAWAFGGMCFDWWHCKFWFLPIIYALFFTPAHPSLFAPVMGNNLQGEYHQWGKHGSVVLQTKNAEYNQDSQWMPSEMYNQTDDKIEFYWGKDAPTGNY